MHRGTPGATLFRRSENLPFRLYETWTLLLEEVEALIISVLANFGFLIAFHIGFRPKTFDEANLTEQAKFLIRLLGYENVLEPRWIWILFLACVKISVTVAIVCFLSALVCQLLYLIRALYSLMRFWSRIVLFVFPTLVFSAMSVRIVLPALDSKDTFLVAFVPGAIVFFKCFSDIRLVVPEIGKLVGNMIRKWEERRKSRGAPDADDALQDGTVARSWEHPLDQKYGEILGVHGATDFETIQKRYQDLVQQYHPDKVRDLGPKLRDVARAEMRRINQAYEYFRRQHAAVPPVPAPETPGEPAVGGDLPPAEADSKKTPS